MFALSLPFGPELLALKDHECGVFSNESLNGWPHRQDQPWIERAMAWIPGEVPAHSTICTGSTLSRSLPRRGVDDPGEIALGLAIGRERGIRTELVQPFGNGFISTPPSADAALQP